MVSVIIPAFDEKDTIREVVSSVIGHPLISEVIVVDDGSSDETAKYAALAGAKVIRLVGNNGKGNAMNEGVLIARENIILFLDADVTGMNHKTISQIIDPVISGKYSMYVGLRSRKVVFLNHLLRYSPIIGGQRAIHKSLWYKVPPQYRDNFKVEIALNYYSKQTPHGMGFAFIEGSTHSIKEVKYGIIVGLIRRMCMVWDVLSVSFRLYVCHWFFRKMTG